MKSWPEGNGVVFGTAGVEGKYMVAQPLDRAQPVEGVDVDTFLAHRFVAEVKAERVLNNCMRRVMNLIIFKYSWIRNCRIGRQILYR